MLRVYCIDVNALIPSNAKILHNEMYLYKYLGVKKKGVLVALLTLCVLYFVRLLLFFFCFSFNVIL